MVKMSLSGVTRKADDLSQEELEICLIALHVFNNLLKDTQLQAPILRSILQAEKYYGFSLDNLGNFANIDKYSDVYIGLVYEKLSNNYQNLINQANLS